MRKFNTKIIAWLFPKMDAWCILPPNVYFDSESGATAEAMCSVLSPGSCWTRDLWSQMATTPSHAWDTSKLYYQRIKVTCVYSVYPMTHVPKCWKSGPWEHERLNLLQLDCRWRPQTSRNANVARCKCRTIQVWENSENPSVKIHENPMLQTL